MTDPREAVARAIEQVQLFSRYNDIPGHCVEGQPVEICRHGNVDAGENEIVVLRRFGPEWGECDALKTVIRECRADAAIAAYEAAAWRPISEAPTDGTPVDLWADGCRWANMEWMVTSPSMPNGAWKRHGADWWDAMEWLEPTHFRPLPAPPETPHER